jgi:hypothetical protein
MSCRTVQKLIFAGLDQRLGAEEREAMARHLEHCRDCAARAAESHRLRAMLRNLPVATPPEDLTARLRVLASHERARRLTRVDFPTRLQHLAGRVKLFADNLMRPVALPFAGGLASALVLFSMLVPTLFFQFNFHNNDVRLSPFYTEASLLETAPFNFAYGDAHGDAVVELTINEKGVVTDYSFPAGKPERGQENSLIANLVLFSSYSPATIFGKPTSGKVVVSVRRSRIVVRG